MKIDANVQKLIDKIKTEKLKGIAKQLEGTDFGLYLPTYADNGAVKMMLDGYSQTERNLVVTVSPQDDTAPADALPVAWMGGKNAKDSKCTHGGTVKCKHCTGHASSCRHCTHQREKTMGDLDAPELDYMSAVDKLTNKADLLESLAGENFGLTLLHAHNEKFMFTKLPDGYVSVISDGITTFRMEADVALDPSFVPNVWRSVNGELRVAGGYSAISEIEA